MFKGSGVALVTPFNDKNEIDYDNLRKLIEFQIKKNTDALIICGTTGEASTLSFEEKLKVINFSVEVTKKRIPVIAGTGSNNTSDAVMLSKEAQNLGVDGLLIVTPYYNKCNKSGLYLHYKTIAENVSIPIILYNVPSRTGVNIDIDTLVKLSKIPNITGIKEASANISRVAEILNKTDNNFLVYSGNDNEIVPFLSLGGAGVISVLANICPKETHDICYNYFNGYTSKASKMQLKYLDLINNLFSEVNPIPVKEALNYLSLNVGKTRLPLGNMNEQNKEKLFKCINDLNITLDV